MRFRTLYLIFPLLALVALALLGYRSDTPDDHFDERVKVALRDAGNHLLLANRDSTSLVMPIIAIGEHRYELSFGTDLYVEPGSLVKFIDQSFAAAKLHSDYITEVRTCATREVAYSYQNSKQKIDQIIPCAGRELPLNCYTIQVIYTNPNSQMIAYNQYPLYSLILVGFIGIGFVYKTKRQKPIHQSDDIYTSIGSFKFYYEEQQLKFQNKVILLTQKECELLLIFSEQINTIVKRDFLVKTVWEDQGVIVGRSLDTYISKLRKKLAEDPTVSLINIHGVGYRLEVPETALA